MNEDDLKLIHGNCLQALDDLDDASVAMTFTSPPYNMNLRIRNGKHCSRQIVKEISTKYKSFDDNLPMDDYFEFNTKVIDKLLRVSDLVFYNIQFLTGNKRALFQLLGHYADKVKEFIVWDKVTAQPAIQSGVMNSQFEVIVVFQNDGAISRRFGGAQFDRGALSNLWRVRRGRKVCADHGATFPQSLAECVIQNFTTAGSVVLDPFMGTGTTGVAALGLGRRFIGVEIDRDYFQFASDRLGANLCESYATSKRGHTYQSWMPVPIGMGLTRPHRSRSRGMR